MGAGTTVKWIDLRDNADKARLKIGTTTGVDGRQRTILFVTGLDNRSRRWQSAIDKLGFQASPSGKYLLKARQDGDPRLQAAYFHPVWPNATLSDMPREHAFLDLNATRATRESATLRSHEESAAAVESGSVRRLGRNAEGEAVFLGAMGRFIQRESGAPIYESKLLRPEMFLRAPDEQALDRCADGFVQSMLLGEVQHSENMDEFLLATLDRAGPYPEADYTLASSVIDAALVRFLSSSYDTAQDAYGDAERLYDYLPPHKGAPRGPAAMPLPLSVVAQRLLGDTSGQTIVIPNAWDGAAFAFLAQGTKIHAYRGAKDLSRHVNHLRSDDILWGGNFDAGREQGSDGVFFNADPALDEDGSRIDYLKALTALRSVKVGGRSVLVLAGDEGTRVGEMTAGERMFFEALSRRYDIQAAIEIPPSLTRRLGTDRSLRLLALRHVAPGADSVRMERFSTVHSWDELKASVDEVIATIKLREAETQGIDVEMLARENEFQRPYIAFSKVGEARTMVPKNLQGPLQYALSTVEHVHGPIDAFVETQLGFGPNTLGERFSPEQVDAIGMGVHRMLNGRGMIIGDETGIGKGRVLSGLATWAQKQDRNVIFVTDRANLFSDLVRDLRDIGEWGRFHPLIMNSDGVLVDMFTNQEIEKGIPPSKMKEILEKDIPLRDLGKNIIFCTYSQISGEDSPKADWVLAQAPEALVIVDEAHVAAGSDSNTGRVVVDLANTAWATVYSSATWAKSSENLHVYSRALPDSINVSSLTDTMRTGGEPFSEVFSSMLARDGAFIRREHDLSKIDFVVEIDDSRRSRNEGLSDKIAEIMGAMTFVGGEINRMLVRANNDTVSLLKAARNARRAALPARAAAAMAAAEGAPLSQGKIFRSSFGAGSVLYQVMRRFLALLNADHVTDLALRAVAQNRKPVIVFEDTGESFVKRIIQSEIIPGIEGEKDFIPETIPAPTVKHLLRHVLKRLGVISYDLKSENEVALTPAQQRARERELAQEDVDLDAIVGRDEDDERAGRVITIAELPGVSDEQQRAYQNGMRKILSLIDDLPDLPLNAIDIVQARLTEAGLRVGEISGRAIRLDPPSEIRSEPIESPKWGEARWKMITRNKKKSAVNATVFGFNNGDYDAICINRSAATGTSLHSSPRFADARRRELIEMQIPEDPTNRIQLYGRVNRFDQLVTPLISIATTGIYGEYRQLMMQNQKLARLSANIRSSRDNAAEIKSVPDLLNKVGEEVARHFLEDNGGIRNRLGVTEDDMERPSFRAVNRLSLYIPLLLVAEQRMVYEEIGEMFNDAIARYEMEGENPLKPKEMDIRAKVKEERIAIGVDMEGLGSAFDGPVMLKKIEWKENLKPIELPALTAMIGENRRLLVQSGYAVLAPGEQQTHVPVDAHLFEVNDAQVATEAGLPFVGIEGFAPGAHLGHLAPGIPDGESVAGELYAEHMRRQAGKGFKPTPAPIADVAEMDEVGEQEKDSGNLGRRKKMRERMLTDVIKLPVVDVSASVEALARVLDAKLRIELAGSKFVDVAQALAEEKPNAVKRAWVKKLWVEKHLPALVPGCLIFLAPMSKKRGPGAQTFDFIRARYIVTDVKVPPKGKAAQLSRWKIEMISPGDEKPTTRTLASLMEGADVISITQNGMPALEVVSETLVSGDIFTLEGAKAPQGNLAETIDRFSWVEKGMKKRSAMILDGNMYLASEWASSTKMGHGMIYSDDRNIRHRAVMLNRSALQNGNLMKYMPVRLWSSQMISELFTRLWKSREVAQNEQVATDDVAVEAVAAIPGAQTCIPFNGPVDSYWFKTDFKSALDTTTNSGNADKKMVVALRPGDCLMISIPKTDAARVDRALKADAKREYIRRNPGWKSYTPEEEAAAREGQVKPSVVRQAKGKKGGGSRTVHIPIKNVDMLKDAVELICRSTGVELYLARGSQLGDLADKVQQDYFSKRKEQARELMGQTDRAVAPIEAAQASTESVEDEEVASRAFEREAV